MKWKNGDINVIKQTSIPKFSTLDNVRTPRRLFELFFDDTLVDTIFWPSKLYGNREKADTSFEITNETFRLFLGMLLLIGCHKLSDFKIYRETTPVILVKQCLIGV